MITRVILRLTLLGCLVLANLALPVNAAGTLAGTTLELPPVAAPKTAAGQLPDPQVWTTWGASQFALAEDGESIWIGASGGVVRWDRALRSYRRYTAVDGLPQAPVLAVAVDAAGNRWFGGDGGLSRLDPGEGWTHFTAANSGLHADYVDAIAVSGSDTLYLGHGLPGGSVTRRAADGTWRWFLNRETAVQADYALILQTRGYTRLWTVAGDEVWVGYRVYDGEKWIDRRPSGVPVEPVDSAADSRHHLWALATGSTVYDWDGSGWSRHDIWVTFTGKVTALAVAADDTVWVGLQQREGNPYHNETARISQLTGSDSWSLGESGPVAALLPTPTGLWAIGPGWLMLPDHTVTAMADGPRFKDLPDILVEPGGKVWLHSSHSEPYSISVAQTFDDNGTAALHDDRWQLLPDSFDGIVLTASERSARGDIWYTGYYLTRGGAWPGPIVRYHGGNRIEYGYGYDYLIYRDIFAQDDRHTWFAADDIRYGEYAALEHLIGLDDGGTPADTGDDVWQDLALPAAGEHPVVAVAAGGRLWYGDSTGLYRYDSSSWLSVYPDRGICDLTPAADGTLYAQVAGFGSSDCQPFRGEVLAVRSDGTRDGPRPIEWLVAQEPESVRSAYRRNTLWAVAPDGAIWTLAESGSELHRRDDAGLRAFALPVDPAAVRRLEVDVHNRVWLAANSQIWRMSGPLDFALQVEPSTWLLAPGRVRQGQVRILSREGYTGVVSLSAVEAPADIAVRFGADSIAAGQSVTLTLEAASSGSPAIHRLVLSGTDGVLTRTTALTVTIVSELHERFLPAVFR